MTSPAFGKPPQAPLPNAPPFQTLAYRFALWRFAHLRDLHYSQFDAVNLRHCKTIVELRAKGDMDEVMRRFQMLCRLATSGREQSYWGVEPRIMVREWDRLGQQAARLDERLDAKAKGEPVSLICADCNRPARMEYPRNRCYGHWMVTTFPKSAEDPAIREWFNSNPEPAA